MSVDFIPYLVCDFCNDYDVVQLRPGRIRQDRREAKKDGWTATRSGGRILDRCPDCSHPDQLGE